MKIFPGDTGIGFSKVHYFNYARGFHIEFRFGNGYSQDYGNDEGQGYGDGNCTGDGFGNSSNDIQKGYPYELIQYWI